MTAAENRYDAYSVPEEIANVITHVMGLLLGIGALVYFVMLASGQNDTYNVVGVSIFSASVILLYTSSILYHALPGQRLKRIFKRIDHIAIYILIAGTYTVFTLSPALRGPWGWTLFGVIWGLAATGIVLKAMFINRFKIFSIVLYLLMGWLVVISLPANMDAFPSGTLSWLLAGGIFYSVGVIFYKIKRIPFNHAIWHLFVLGGTASHLAAAYYCLFNLPA